MGATTAATEAKETTRRGFLLGGVAGAAAWLAFNGYASAASEVSRRVRLLLF